MIEIENKVLARAYSLLRRVTPLKDRDCGCLCEGVCCKGDGETGMWLFPGEADYFRNRDGFTVIDGEANGGFGTVVCSGKCNRNERPLACRIFPLFPVVFEEKGVEKIAVIKDPRAGICPLTLEEAKLSPSFYRAVRQAAKRLVRDEEIHAYLKTLGEEITETERLRSLLNGEKT